MAPDSSSSLVAIFERPRLSTPEPLVEIDAWFARIASRLLGSWTLSAGERVHRFVEIEFYYHGPCHGDPFVHAHSEQLHVGRWYFHRMGGAYRGGSFKGLDLTFGDGVAYGGILIRSLETPDGQLIVGPSLCVDHLLAITGSSSVASLDRSIGGRPAWDPNSPLHIAPVEGHPRAVFRTRRVGLTLKKHKDALAVDRIARAYRFLTEPRRVTKGRVELIDALLAEGRAPEEIRALTGSPSHAIVARQHVRDGNALV